MILRKLHPLRGWLVAVATKDGKIYLGDMKDGYMKRKKAEINGRIATGAGNAKKFR